MPALDWSLASTDQGMLGKLLLRLFAWVGKRFFRIRYYGRYYLESEMLFYAAVYAISVLLEFSPDAL